MSLTTLNSIYADSTLAAYFPLWPIIAESCSDIYQNYALLIGISLIAVLLILSAFYVIRKYRYKAEIKVTALSRPRFRKRDKVMFYGRKILRKVNILPNSSHGGRARKRDRQYFIRLTKKILQREQPLTLQVKGPSAAFLEEDISEQAEHRLPSEVIYMLKSIRVFGFFEKPLFLELCKHIESVPVPVGQLLFQIGELDDSIYVVQTGRLQVFITEPDGTELALKYVPAGESVVSLLSIMDVLTGHVSPYKTVSARALEDSTVLRLRADAFKIILQKHPESLVRIVQVIMVRLQRVTFTALHKYLGFTTQLIKKSTPLSPKTSPARKATHTHEKDFAQLSSSGEFKYDYISERQPPAAAIETRFSAVTAEELENLKEAGLEVPKIRRKKYMPLSDEQSTDYFAIAVEGIKSLLGIDDDEDIQSKVSIQTVTTGTVLTKQDSAENISLYYVITGALLITQKSVDNGEENILLVAGPGEFTGALAVLTGEPSLFTIKVKMLSRIAIISKNNTYELLRLSPPAILNLSNTVIRNLSPFVRQIDFALDWMSVESGRALYRQDDISDYTHIVLSGRLRSVVTLANGKKELVGEYGRGDLVGIVEVLTQSNRATTVMAVRDSELAKIPEGLLNAIKVKHPAVVTRLIHLLGHRILGNLQKNSFSSDHSATIGTRPTGSNFATVAILSVTDKVPLSAFTMELYYGLNAIGATLRLTSDFIKKTLGNSALEASNEYQLCSWLGQQEDHHRVVLYQCDSNFSAWTQRCIRQADCILIVALGEEEPTIGTVEKQLEHLAVRTQKELILLHHEDSGKKPNNTVQWLNLRSWCSSHHHIRCHKRVFIKKQSKLMDVYNRLFESQPNVHSDFSRLARFLTGTSIGLVLGGGGARGAAHVGMIKAITEAGIPIDMVGGVSIGALMGALWCQEKDMTRFIQVARSWSFKMTSYWRQILDLTYPITAMFKGEAFNRSIREVIGERQIEDLWLPYFTITTDITNSTMRTHTHGSLWRYVRSSMSLSGYLPPLCDPIDGHLLLDGGYVNNLPADIMKEMGAETIIAIDVGSQDDTDLTNYGDTLSGWWLLWKRWNPWATSVKVPSLPEIQSRLAYVSCVRHLEQVKQCDYCTYVRPPIDKYKTMQFGSFDEIMDVGYNHGKMLFTAMISGQKSLHTLLDNQRPASPHKVNLKTVTFTDLAEIVCKIKPPHRPSYNSISNYETDDDEYISEPEADAFYMPSRKMQTEI